MVAVPPREPPKSGLIGVDSLARFPDAAVILVDNPADLDAARHYFPQNPTICWPDADTILTNGLPYIDHIAGRQVIAWPTSRASRLEFVAVAQVAAQMRMSSTVLQPMAETPHAAAAAALRGFPAVPKPPKPAEAPAARPAQPAALGVVESDGSVRKRAPKPDRADVSGFSHDALAAAFTARNGDWRYVAGWGQWLAWDGLRWAKDGILTVFELARQSCRDQAAIAATYDVTPSFLRSIQSAGTITAVEKIARADPVHAAPVDRWDADPWLLNTPAGVVDLRTGASRTSEPADHLTRITRAAPTDDVPARWLQFLEDATAGDRELMGFLQRMAGYCLTGTTREHALFFVHGPGGNGKGTFLNTLTWILNDYATVASMETFVESHNDRHPTDVASLMGARLVSAQEVDEGRRWAEAKVTSLTGGDPITARFMRQDPFTFQPQFKLVIVGNNKPILRNVNDAIRRRLYLIPFTAKIAADKRDVMLHEKLRAEAGGILRWCIEGCLDWQRGGLRAPESVKAATEKYLAAQDKLGNWIDECCDLDPLWTSTVGDLYKSFAAWCEDDAGEGTVSRRRFSDQLETRGFTIKPGGRYVVNGIRVKKTTDQPQQGRFVD